MLPGDLAEWRVVITEGRPTVWCSAKPRISEKIIPRDLGASSKSSGSNSEKPKPTLSRLQKLYRDSFPDLFKEGEEIYTICDEDELIGTVEPRKHWEIINPEMITEGRPMVWGSAKPRISGKIIPRDLGASSKSSGRNSEKPKPTLSLLQKPYRDSFPDKFKEGEEIHKICDEDELIGTEEPRKHWEIINSENVSGMLKATMSKATMPYTDATDDSEEEDSEEEDSVEEDSEEDAPLVEKAITFSLPPGHYVRTTTRFAASPSYRFSKGLPCKKHIAVLVKCFKKTLKEDGDRREKISAWNEMSRVWINLQVFQGRVDLHNYSNYRHEKSLEIARHLSVIGVPEEELPRGIAEIFEVVDKAVDTDTAVIWQMVDVTLIPAARISS